MVAAVLTEEWEVQERLEQLDLSKAVLLEVVRACVVAHGGCTDNDPPAARGWEVWRWGIRRLRELLRTAGWFKDDSNSFSTIVNHQRRIRIAVTNTDDVTGLVRGNEAPQNRIPKGSTAARAATANQLTDQLPLSGSESWPIVDGQVADYQTWFLCVYIMHDVVRAELARFNGFDNGYLADCQERIFIVSEGDWDPLDSLEDPDTGPEFDFEIQRKG